MRENFNEHVKYWKNMFVELKDAYKTFFCEQYKFDTNDAYWTGNVLSVGDYFVGLYDVIYAVNYGIIDEQFFKWYDYSLTLYEHSLGNVSLENYVKGIREYSEKDVNKLRELQCNYDKSKVELYDFLNSLKNGN